MKKSLKKQSMSIYLPKKLASFVDAQVEVGLHASRSDYLADLIRQDYLKRGAKENG